MTEPRGAEEQQERVAGLAAELVRLQVDVIVASGVTLGVLEQTTSTIPVVMAASDDPVARGHVRSLGHPGGNFTGLATQGIETAGKRIELLKEIVPAAARVAVLWDQASRPVWQATEATALKRGWKLLSLEIRDKSAIEGAFSVATKARAGAIVVSATRFTGVLARRVAELAAKSRLPAIYEFRFFTDAGGLISYGPDNNEIWRRAAVFVDKILKGTKPADLPVEQVAKFDLVINPKTAKALGLTIPPSLLLRANQVIE
jgi:putative ABC transport system substrate-binding protein